ncbi:hypothetical protein U9J35_22525 [Rossellomorea aquimaris]|nr:hypothetical protein [Rossellomorea aquimaris]WRP06593.1 hypothetical protein U9J35_22525 [Rossellomorea aquimaris]
MDFINLITELINTNIAGALGLGGIAKSAIKYALMAGATVSAAVAVVSSAGIGISAVIIAQRYLLRRAYDKAALV